MQGSGKRRERSSSLSVPGQAGKQSRDQLTAHKRVEGTTTSVGMFSSSPERMREAEISAEDALRRYQAETQQAYATFPYQVHRKPVPQPAQRQSAATIGGPNQLQRIPEVPSEGSSGEAAAKSDSKPELTMPSSLRAGGPIQTVRHDRAASMEEYSRALPRNLDPVTGKRQAGKQGGRRPSLPYVFEPLTDPQSQRASFPNPHQSVAGPSDSQLSTTQLQRRASQQSQSPILSRNPSSFGPGQNEDRRRRNQDNPYEFGIPPTPPLGQPRTFQTVPLSIKKASTTQQAAAPSSAPQAGSSNSAWSSTTESEPTPTPSSIAATRERNAQLEAQLQPVQLTLPATFAHRSAISPQAATSSAIGARFGGDGAQGRPPVPADAVSAANVASIKASATPFAPTKSSNLSAPPIRSNSDDTTFSGEIIALPDGTQIPTVRTDFQNLKRISMPKPAAFEDPAGKQQTPTVAGHVIAREGAKKVPKNDGSSRTIYSPTPQTLAAARRQSSMLQVPQAGAQGGGTNDQRIPSPLSASAEAPAAPQIPQSLKFDRAVPSAGASTSYEPQNLPDPATAPRDVEKQGVMHRGDGIKSVPGRTRTKSDDTDIRTRADAEQLDFDEHSRRNTFGEPAPGMLEEANRKLYQYQMQQLGKEAKAKDVSTSRQPPSTDVGSVERVEKKSDQPIVATTSIVRRESTASQQSRRDSIGSATTAFDSPTKEEFPANLFRQSSQTGSAKAIRGTARETVAPPSDVQEVQEPEEIVASDDDDGTEIDDHDDAYDTSFETRMPFVVDTYTMNGPDYDDVGDKSEFRFIPISSVKAGKARRPRTRDTRVSFRSNPSHIEQQGPGSRQHGAAPACRQCFRAGFDCAMNLQLGEGTAARKAFQDFVAAGGLNAFSIRDGGAVGGGRPRTAGSLVDSNAGRITVEEALGRNYVDKLGEVAFGESALSRPVTRGMYNELLEEKQEQDRRKQLATNHKPWVGDVDEETEFTKDGGLQDAHQQRSSTDKVKRSLSNSHKDRRLSQMTLQDGVDNDQIEAHDGDARQVLLNNMKRSGSHKRGQLEEGEIVDYDPADYEDEDDFDGEQDVLSSTSSDSDPVVWADRWSAWAKLRQMLVYWVIIFALQALASGYTNTVGRIITNEQPSQAVTILYQLGSLSYNGSQGGGLFFANLIVGFGRQRITLILLVAVAVVCAIAGFMHNVYALLACQSGLGLLAGVFIFLSLATVMDMFATSRGRLFGVGSIALVLVGGQLAGPWISKRVLSLLGWPWTYWLTIIVAAVLVVYDGIFARETAAFVLFRRYALRVKRSGQGWTPEPQQETKLRQVFGDDLARPVRLMRYNPLLVVLALGIAVLAGMYMFLFSGLQAVFVRVHGLSSGSAALAVAVSAAVGLVVGVVAIVLLNSKRSSRHDAGGFATKARPLYLDEKGHIDTRRPLRAKTESLLVTGLFATAAFSFALYTMALTSSFATTWFLTAFSIVLSTASLLVVGVSVVQYVLDGYSMPRRTTLRDVVAREEVSTPTLLQNEDDDRFTSYSRRTAARLAAAAAGASRFKGGRGGRHGQSQEEKLHAFGDHRSDAGDERAAWLDAGETVTAQRDKRWLDETALAGVTAVVSLPFTICPVLSFISFQAFAKLSFGAFAVIFASVALAVLLALLCVYLYGAKPRARSLSMLDEADADRAHNRRARKREKRALKRQQSLPRTQSMTESQVQAMQNRKGSAPARLAQKLVDALGYKPLSDDGLDMYQRSKGPEQGRTTTRAPVSLMREVETRSTATDAADGRRELWLAKFIANRDKSQKAPETASADVRPAPAIRLNEATEAPQRLSSLKTDTAGNGLKQTMKAFSGVMFGRTTTANNDVQSPDTIARNLPASTSLPANLHSSTNNFASPPTPYHPLSPPPRAQPRASISQHRDPTHPAPVDGFEIVQFQTSPPLPDQHADRPYTPVMTRKSVDMSSTRLNIMARSHSQPLNLYAAAGAAGGSPAGARGERQRQTSGRGI